MRIGRYELSSETLGSGGMGIVRKALDVKTNEVVAIKHLPPHMSGDRSKIRALKREYRLAKSFDSENVIKIHDIITRNGVYLIMEYVDGMDLRKFTKSQEFNIERSKDIIRQCIEGLYYLHSHNVIHGDVKPQNFLISMDGRVKITDFGFSRAGRRKGKKEAGGTIEYMSPEQIIYGKTDEKTDVYSYGATIYSYLTEDPPFSVAEDIQMLAGKNAAYGEVLLRQVKEKPRGIREINPVVPPAVERVIMSCLEKEPENRPSSSDLYHELVFMAGH